MSQDGSGSGRPQRLASARAAIPSDSQSAVSSVATNLRETTLGGVQKTKFAPVVNARRAKKDPAEGEAAAEPPLETKPQRDRGAARGRGRGRGGSAGSSGRGLLAESTPVVSGPFSLGPSGMKGKSVATMNVAFAGGISSRGSGAAGGGRMGGVVGGGRNGTGGGFVSSAPSIDDSEIIDVEKLIDIESMELGEDHCPVNILPSSEEITMGLSLASPLELLMNPGELFLVQLPEKIPSISPDTPAEEEEIKPKAQDPVPEGIEGEYGKLCVHASGKLSLEINGFRYFFEPGSNLAVAPRVAGSQTILAIDPEYEQSFELGKIKTSFVATLDFEAALNDGQ